MSLIYEPTPLLALSILAYLALVLLLAGGPGMFRPDRPGRWLGLAGPWAAFLFLPNDSLPPFLDFAWSGPAFWLGLSLGAPAEGGRKPARSRPWARETLPPIFILVLAWLFLCYYAFRRGLPGDLPGLSVFAATPLLTKAGPAGVIGLMAIFLALAPFAARRAYESPGQIMFRFSLSAFLITAFFPFSLSALLKTSAPLALGLDYFLFWGKVLLLNRLLAPRLAKIPPRFTALSGAAGLLLSAFDF